MKVNTGEHDRYAAYIMTHFQTRNVETRPFVPRPVHQDNTSFYTVTSRRWSHILFFSQLFMYLLSSGFYIIHISEICLP